MSTQNTSTRSFQVNAAMSRDRVVACSNNGYLDLAGCDSAIAVGVIQEDVTAGAYENARVRLWGAGTMMIAVTGCPLTAGDIMVVVTSGYVSVTNARAGNTSTKVGILLESASSTSNGQLREVSFGFLPVT